MLVVYTISALGRSPLCSYAPLLWVELHFPKRYFGVLPQVSIDMTLYGNKGCNQIKMNLLGQTQIQYDQYPCNNKEI